MPFVEQLMCDWCGRELTDEEIEYPEPEGPICEDCYCQHFYYSCVRCGEHDHIEYQHRCVVVFEDEACGPGIYRVTSRPYAVQPMIGQGWLVESALTPLAILTPMDIKNNSYVDDGEQFYEYPCRHLCLDCQESYVLIGDEWT
jgi:hypothetical protein